MASRKESGRSNSTRPISTQTTPSVEGRGEEGACPLPGDAAGPPSPDALRIVIDSREQRPWTFPVHQVAVCRRALPAGDYSIVGLEGRLAIERKSLGDLVGTVIHDWLRFRKELVRLSGFDAAVIAVEADIGQVYRHEYESEASPASVLGRLNSIWFDHGVPVAFWGERKTAQDQAHRFLLMGWRKLHVVGPDEPGLG